MQINPKEKGHAALDVDLVFNQSTVIGAYATNPMNLLTPCSRGPSVCTYASNFGGGLVAGDQTRLDLRIGRGARCFLGTQASTKVYRNPYLLPCSHFTSAAIQEDALLVFSPAPVQPFAGSSYSQTQEFRLARGAGLALLDWVTSGRAACGERWTFAHFSSRNEVWTEAKTAQDSLSSDSPGQNGSASAQREECAFVESLCLDPAEGPLSSSYRTGRFNCFAMLLLIGAPLHKLAVRLLDEVRSLSIKRRASLLVSASPVQDGAVLRLAGEEVGDVDKYVRCAVAPLAQLLGEDPWRRRL